MSSPATVLVIEDEMPMRDFIRASLDPDEFSMLEADRGKDGIRLAAMESPQLILLDLGLPDMDGVDIARRIREWSEVPMIVLSARDEVADKVAALDAGADDYLTKPFSLEELMARIRVAFRRTRVTEAPTPTVFEAHGVHINFDNGSVYRNGESVKLTTKEFRILMVLAQEPGRLLTHRQLLTEVWGEEHAMNNHYLRVYMNQLRQKLEANPAHPKLIVSEYGIGYRLRG